ncbi:Mobile element protein [Fimbriiglobus ruber]|uniref:Mobile element protein n=1 Tax=Fimbriiglobus ruber TaxID=1908690 RepID=A0A225E3V1_9BACT|nr:Mobile element protein [Fimbriiglobus ruber]
MFGPKETSDFWVEGLESWWDQVKGGWGHVRRLVIYLDNGPQNAGTRTQFVKRMVALADRLGVEIRLVYYPHTTARTTRLSGAGRRWSRSGVGRS